MTQGNLVTKVLKDKIKVSLPPLWDSKGKSTAKWQCHQTHTIAWALANVLLGMVSDLPIDNRAHAFQSTLSKRSK